MLSTGSTNREEGLTPLTSRQLLCFVTLSPLWLCNRGTEVKNGRYRSCKVTVLKTYMSKTVSDAVRGSFPSLDEELISYIEGMVLNEIPLYRRDSYQPLTGFIPSLEYWYGLSVVTL